jgi:hypothetical protein
VAKWLTRWSAKPVFEGSIPSRCSIYLSRLCAQDPNYLQGSFRHQRKIVECCGIPLKPDGTPGQAKPGLTPIFCHAVPEMSACAPCIKERRLKCINATSFHRKSGQMGHPALVAGEARCHPSALSVLATQGLLLRACYRPAPIAGSAAAIAVSRSGTLIGLETYPSIPASIQRSRSPLMAWAVMAMIGMWV